MAQKQRPAHGSRGATRSCWDLVATGSRWLLASLALLGGVALLGTLWHGFNGWAGNLSLGSRGWDGTVMFFYTTPGFEAGIIVGLAIRTWGRWRQLLLILGVAIWIENLVNLGVIFVVFSNGAF